MFFLSKQTRSVVLDCVGLCWIALDCLCGKLLFLYFQRRKKCLKVLLLYSIQHYYVYSFHFCIISIHFCMESKEEKQHQEAVRCFKKKKQQLEYSLANPTPNEQKQRAKHEKLKEKFKQQVKNSPRWHECRGCFDRIMEEYDIPCQWSFNGVKFFMCYFHSDTSEVWGTTVMCSVKKCPYGHCFENEDENDASKEWYCKWYCKDHFAKLDSDVSNAKVLPNETKQFYYPLELLK